MEQALPEIRGREVAEVVVGPSATTIKFVDGWGVAIFNDFVWKAGQLNSRSIPSDIKGRVLEDAYVAEGCIVLQFEGGASIEVDLSNDAYHGPEAAEIFGPASEEIVIN